MNGSEIRVCAAVMRRNGKTLICSRPSNSAHAGFWEFPGGKIDEGESMSQCLVREIREELGVGVIPLDCIFEFSHEYPGKTVRLYFIRAVLEDPDSEIIPCEGQEARWVDTAALDSENLLPADIPMAGLMADSFRKMCGNQFSRQ